jgi:hypothetical protein
MSVLARMRKLSQYEFYTNALKLRKSMRSLLLRDLGIKDKVREAHEFAREQYPLKISKHSTNRGVAIRKDTMLITHYED